ncbi:MAG: DUF721 domain-containing protein [Synergistaceae bacterium]|jgi:hypothetical protein|nr:DUF721 domain-containing protein [Synergistaceae bacterium]
MEKWNETTGAAEQRVEAILRRVLPPGYEERLKLDRAAAEWARVVGPTLAAKSAPLGLTNGELLITAENPLVANRLSMIAGNIARALWKQWKIEVRKVRVTVGRVPQTVAPTTFSPPRPAVVRVKEEETLEVERECLEKGLPEDVAKPLAHLEVFFSKRFKK